LESVYRATYRGFKSLILRSESSFKTYSAQTAPHVPLPIMAMSGE